MANVDVLNWDKKKVGSVELDKAVFEAPVRKDLLHTVTRWQLACRRQGTHQAKVRSEVSGGGKKPFKQKGTGNARQGTIRSPVMPGGAVIFGPRPRSYAYNLPAKVRKAGLRSALSHLYAEGKISVVEDMASEGKTNELAKRLKKFGTDKAVLVDVAANDNFKRASRNMKSVKYYAVEGVNVYDLLKYDHLIMTKESVAKITARCQAE